MAEEVRLMAVEIVAIVLATVLAVLTLGVADVAFLVIMGVVHIARCAHCHRLRLTVREGPLQACMPCRHERLLHPLHAVHHPVRAHSAHVSDAEGWS
jgi:molybdenum cofactor biosynthesis enzyme MoaA